MNKIILYIATSKDGFIADVNGDVDWLPQPQNDEDLKIVGYKKLIESIDTIVMGRKSFEQIVSFGDWAWTDKHTYVFSSKPLENSFPCVTITKESPLDVINEIKNHKTNKDIWLLGGAKLAQSFAQEGLIDEIILTIVPQILGDGIPLGLSLDDFELRSERLLMERMIQKTYSRKAS